MARDSGSKDSTRGVADAAGKLVTSLGRFSIAMGIFGARQAARIVSDAGAEAAASFDEGLTSATRRARAVNANLQSGLLDAFIGLTGLGPIGQPPIDAATPLGMSLPTAVSRRVAGMRTVGEGAPNRSVPQSEFITRLADDRRQASDGRAALDRTVARLWRSEGLAGSVGRHLVPENSLNHPSLSRQVLPVAHVGFGSGSAEVLAFDAARLRSRFSARCSKDCVEFAYEGVGATLRFYERGLFKLVSGALDFIELDAPEGPDPAGFFAAYLNLFPSSLQRLITHGYGRIITFSNISVYSAIEEATTLPSERIEPAVHGVAFAFAMINSIDLPRILRQSAIPYQPSVRVAFQNGLIFALVFLDWYAPGVLARWQPQPGLETELIDHARQEAAQSAERGFPLAFRLANPRS
jgi:hypothetical protein